MLKKKKKRESIIIYFLPIILFSLINPRLLRRKLQQNFWACQSIRKWHLGSSKSFGFVLCKIKFAEWTRGTSHSCELSRYREVSKHTGTAENSLTQKGKSVPGSKLWGIKNRKFEPIVLFGVAWQVPKDQIDRNVLRLAVSGPRYLDIFGLWICTRF